MPNLFRHVITRFRNIWFLTSIRQLKEKLEPPEARSFPHLLQASCQSSWQNALMMLQESGGKLVMRVLSTKRWSVDALPHQETNQRMKDFTTDSVYMHSHPRSTGTFLRGFGILWEYCSIMYIQRSNILNRIYFYSLTHCFFKLQFAAVALLGNFGTYQKAIK